MAFGIDKIIKVKIDRNGILFPKFVWPTVTYSDGEKLLKFESKGREFAKILRFNLVMLEQFIQRVKGQNNFW